MRRPALLAALLGVGLLVGCEDDSAYTTGPSTFQKDTLDGAAAGAAGMTDAGIDAPGGGGATGTGGATGAAGSSADAGP